MSTPEASRKWRAAHPDYYRELDKKRNQLPERKALNTRKAQEYRKRNPDRYKAWNKIKIAIDNGSLVKQPCVVCKSLKADAHHPDPRCPYAVIWLCRKHHKEEHGKA